MNIIIVERTGRISKYSIQKNYKKWKKIIKNDTINIDKKQSQIINNDSINNESSKLSITRVEIINNDNPPDIKKKVSKESIKEREVSFKKNVYSFSNYPKEMLDEFYDYWREPNKTKTKMKWEIQKTWDTNLRLKTWQRNQKKWGGTETKNAFSFTRPSISKDEDPDIIPKASEEVKAEFLEGLRENFKMPEKKLNKRLSAKEIIKKADENKKGKGGR